MKRIVVILVFSFAATALAFGQTRGQKTAKPAKAEQNVEQAVRKLERDLTQAYVERNAAALERLLSTDFNFTGINGTASNKTQSIAATKDPQAKYEAIELKDIKVRLHGDTAVTTGQATIKATLRNRDVSGAYRYTAVYVQQQPQQWRAIALQFTRVEEPEASTAQTTEDFGKTLAEANVKQPRRINKRPFVELALKAKQLIDGGEIDVSRSLEIEAFGDLGADGVIRNVGITQAQSHQKTRELAEEFIAAVSSSGALDFLEGASQMRFTASLNENSVSVSASAEVESAEKASQLARGYNLLLAAGINIKRGRDDELVYKSTKIAANGNRINVTLTMPRETAGKLLLKQISAL